MKTDRAILPPDIAAVADLLGRVRARIILEQVVPSVPVAATPTPDAELPSTRLLLRIEEVAEALALSRSTVYALIRSGEIRSIRIGRSTRVSAEWLRQWIRQQEVREP
jgi:excisionase family DNA binding protein